MKKIFISLVFMYSMMFSGIKNDYTNYDELDKLSSNELAKTLSAEMVKGIRLPMVLDEMTRLLSIYSYNSSIFFRKEINIKHKRIYKIWEHNKKKVINTMFKIEAQTICYNTLWKYLIFKKNIIPEFNYFDKNNKPLFSYTIEIEDCNKLN